MTRVLITGGSGFLGSHVAAALAARPDVEFVVAADVRHPAEPRLGVRFEHYDVTDPGTLVPLLQQHRIDTVVHLAAIVGPGGARAHDFQVDVRGTQNVLSACVTVGVGRIVVSSSAAAYGYHPDNPDWLREDHPLRGNDDFPYARHKRLVEKLLADYRVAHPELEQVVLRIGTILGPAVRSQVTQLWEGPRILAIRGSDSPFVFVWVDDVADAVARAAVDGPPGIYNVAGSGSMTVRDIAARLGKPVLALPAWLLASALWVGHVARISAHGPEKVRYLRYRPLIANDALIERFGFTPRLTTREAFEAYLATRPGLARR